jgi:hypothetical protein
MIAKSSKKRLNALQKADALLRVLQAPETVENWYSGLSAPQLRDLRDLLQAQVRLLSGRQAKTVALTDEAIRGRFEPIPNYFHKHFCLEPLDACYNETCLTSNPGCFSTKMKEQIAILITLLRPLALLSTTGKEG